MNKPVDPATLAIVDAPLYAPAKKVYPQGVSGAFRNIKWGLMAFCLGVYYFLPFVRWDRGPNAPNQAVLVDFPNRRFYFFFIELWPQELYYFTGLLVIAAMTLFLLNAIGGRIWCGYWCPQTVWTDLFLAVERWIEGDRRERMRKAKAKLTARRVGEIAAKHAIWLMIAWWTGGAWVLYFADAPTLVKELATFQAPTLAYVFIGILTFTTYALAGHMREQVCIYMCPWPRIQAALTDEYALNVAYRYDRGEPRTPVAKVKQMQAIGERVGDCVNCRQCVAVCPTGVDIRDGSQLACIQCGLCIDACDAMMAKLGRAPRLIGYDSDINIKRRLAGEAPVYRLFRARTIIYLAVIAVTAAVMLYSLFSRAVIDLNVLHDRNPLFVTLSDGSVRNAYTLRFLNKRPDQRTIELKVTGVPVSLVHIIGEEPAGRSIVVVGADQTREVRVLVTAPSDARIDKSTPVVFTARDVNSGDAASARDHFFGP